nr:hypothetical protein [Pseudobdellovibrionaceae bacterium]
QKIPFDSLARGESSSVMVNNGLRKQRHGTYEGTNYEGYAHIRYDGPNNERFRIHFQYDSKKQRIVVTRITLHLDSASPKKP